MPATPFQKEAWTEYGIGVVILFVRLFARHKVVGIRSWQGDDYFTIVALAFWTVRKKTGWLSLSAWKKTGAD